MQWQQNHYEKLIDEIGNMTVLELADLVKALEEKFGISAAMPMQQPQLQQQQQQLQQQKKKLNIK